MTVPQARLRNPRVEKNKITIHLPPPECGLFMFQATTIVLYYLPHTLTLSDPCTLIVCLQVFHSPL